MSHNIKHHYISLTTEYYLDISIEEKEEDKLTNKIVLKTINDSRIYLKRPLTTNKLSDRNQFLTILCIFDSIGQPNKQTNNEASKQTN